MLNIPGIKPNQIYAIDNDPIAVMISKFNYYLTFSDASFPNIYLCDYLKDGKKYLNKKFDYIITNPPWGALTGGIKKHSMINSGETFSYFFVEANNYIKKSGQFRFLLPESILNVKLHRDIRKYMLDEVDLFSIKTYSKLFSGVTTKYVEMRANKTGDSKNIKIESDNNLWSIKKYIYKFNINNVFRLSHCFDEHIINKVLNKKKYDLSESVWALGIVTGDNKKKLFSEYKEGLEKVYTGKEIMLYKINCAKKYIKYNRNELQQVAKDEYYRANSKLVYKFISKKLAFAIDESSSLFLNSANILIPKIPNMSIKTSAAFLNSELYQYLYIKLFGEIKILKGNLMQLPFPDIDGILDKKICNIVDKILYENISYSDLHDMLQKIIYHDIYNLNDDEVTFIRKELYG